MKKLVYRFKRRNLIYSINTLLLSLGKQHDIVDSDFQFVNQLLCASMIMMMMIV